VTAPRRVRPSIVVLTIGVAAVAGLPASAVAPQPPAPPSAAAAAASGAGESVAAGRPVESMRFDPVSFRVTGSPAPAAVVAVLAQPLVTTTAKPGTAAARAIEFALAQRGLPYVWGGNGPQRGDAGFDCSGLTTAAYAHAGIELPRTAHTQYYAGPHVPDGAPLEPGDLVFYGVPERVHHVGLYLGEGRMVNAPTFGKPVRLAYVRYNGDDYLGATRPAAGIDAPADGLLATPDLPVEVPPVPSPQIPPAPEEFAAPEVPAAELPPVQAPTGPIAVGPVPPTGGALAEGAPALPPAGTALPGSTQPGSTQPGDVSGTPAPGAGATTPGSAPPAPPAPSAEPTPAQPTTTTQPTTTPPTTTPPTTTPPTAPPTSSSEQSAPPTAPATPVPARPTSLTLPGGRDVALAAAEQGPDGLPVAPTTAGTGALRWSPAEAGRTARATVSLHPDADVSALTPGGTVTVHGADGATTLTIRSHSTVTPAAAADRASARGETLRLVLLRADPATGEVLVVIAE
jgi:cell wall-associated NlpC family hydrolase